jgi:hypothetical protein
MDEKLLVPADANTMLSFGRTGCHLIALIRFMLSPDLKGKQHFVFVDTKPTRANSTACKPYLDTSPCREPREDIYCWNLYGNNQL